MSSGGEGQNQTSNQNEEEAGSWEKTKNALYYTVVGMLIGIVSTTLYAKEPDIYGGLPLHDVQQIYFDGVSEQAERLAEALRIPTVSHTKENISDDALRRLIKFIQTSYPTIYNSESVSLEMVNELSLLYTVEGADPDLPPYILAAHLDVVPVNEPTWSYPAFQGVITTDGEIVGRGAIDDKHIVFGILEALSTLLDSGYVPQRTFYIAFGHDEEVVGFQGAAHISRRLKERGVKEVEFILDEGTFLIKEAIAGISRPVALVSVVEKQRLDLEVSVRGEAGHSSMPEKDSPITIMAEAITRLNENPHPVQFPQEIDKDFFKYIAHGASLPFKAIYANMWIFSKLISAVLARQPTTNSLLRTTTAFSIIQSGIKSNVIPSKATLVVNHRLHPASTIEEVIEHDKRVMADDRLSFRLLDSSMTAPVSPYGPKVLPFTTIAATIRQIYPDALVAPSMLMGGTDSIWYQNLTKCIYKFSPVLMTVKETKRFHGDDELITIENYHRVINFFYRFIINADEVALRRKEERGSTSTEKEL